MQGVEGTAGTDVTSLIVTILRETSMRFAPRASGAYRENP